MSASAFQTIHLDACAVLRKKANKLADSWGCAAGLTPEEDGQFSKLRLSPKKTVLE
jgi:hypothetical protein